MKIVKGKDHHVRKTYDHQTWTTGTCRGVDSLETNLAATGNPITLRSLVFRNRYNFLSVRVMVTKICIAEGK